MCCHRYFRISQAVKRSRVKSKLRTQQTLERVNQLKTENELLEEKIKMLTKELGFLKDLFLAHAGKANHWQIIINFFYIFDRVSPNYFCDFILISKLFIIIIKQHKSCLFKDMIYKIFYFILDM